MNALDDHILFAGGGTAGHLFPGLAVADELRRTRAGCTHHLCRHRQAVRDAAGRAGGLRLRPLPCRPFPRQAQRGLAVSDRQRQRLLRRAALPARAAMCRWSSDWADMPACRRRVPRRARAFLTSCWSRTPCRAAPRAGWRRGAALVCSAFEDSSAAPALGLPGARDRQSAAARVRASQRADALSARSIGPPAARWSCWAAAAARRR